MTERCPGGCWHHMMMDGRKTCHLISEGGGRSKTHDLVTFSPPHVGFPDILEIKIQSASSSFLSCHSKAFILTLGLTAETAPPLQQGLSLHKLGDISQHTI
jgi:hypothetical protein